MGEPKPTGVTKASWHLKIADLWHSGYRWQELHPDAKAQKRIKEVWDRKPALQFVRKVESGKLNEGCKVPDGIGDVNQVNCRNYHIGETARVTATARDVPVTVEVSWGSEGKQRADTVKQAPIAEAFNYFNIIAYPFDATRGYPSMYIRSWSNGGYRYRSCGLTRFKTLEEAEVCLRSDTPFEHEAEVKIGDFDPAIPGDEIVVARRVFSGGEGADARGDLQIISYFVFVI